MKFLQTSNKNEEFVEHLKIQSSFLYFFLSKSYLKCYRVGLADQSVADVATGSLRGSNDLHDLPSLQSEVASDGIAGLDAHQHVLLELVASQQLGFLFICHHNVLRHQLVFCDVNEKLRLEELFDDVLRSHLNQHLFCRWAHGSLNDHDGSVDVLFLHSRAIGADELDADLRFVGEEHEHLVGGIVVVVNEHDEIGTGWALLTKMKIVLLTCFDEITAIYFTSAYRQIVP